MEKIDNLTYPIKNLFPSFKKKRGEHPCKHCSGIIKNGEQYASIEYRDGFLNKNFGAFHNECWNKINIK